MAILYVDDVEMPAPSSMKVSLFEVGSTAERSASGNMVVDRVAVKRRLALQWARLLPTQMGTLLGAVAEAFFEVRYPDPHTGAMRTMTCHCDERSTGVMRILNEQPEWVNVEMEWTER